MKLTPLLLLLLPMTAHAETTIPASTQSNDVLADFANDTKRTLLTLMGFASIDIVADGWSSAGCIPAIEMALHDINMRADILPEYQLQVDMKDSRCDAGRGIEALFEHLENPPTKVMILGGGCSAATTPVARTAPYLGLIQMSYSAASPDLSRRDLYKTFFRTARSDLAMVPPIIALCLKYKWNHIATIHQQNELFASTLNELHSQLPLYNITLITGEIFNSDSKTNLLNVQKKNARIIFYDSYEGPARQTFCYVYQMGLYGPRYQWIVPGWFSPDWIDVNDTECTPAQIRIALQYALTVTDLKEDLSENVTDSGQTFAQYLERYETWPSFKTYGYNAYHPFGYDAVWAIALALNATATTLAEKKYPKYSADGNASLEGYLRLEDFQYDEFSVISRHMFEAMTSVEFYGVSGPVLFNRGERSVEADIQQILGDSFVRVMRYGGTNGKLVEMSPIQWQGDGPPISYPEYRVEILYNSPVAVYVFFAMASIGIICAVSVLAFNLLNTDHLHIRMSSPRLNNVIIVGTILAYWSCILFGLDSNIVPAKHMKLVCQMKTWILAISFTLSFGAMFAKTYRVHSVFTQMTVASNKAVQDIHLFGMVGALLFSDIIILLCWTFLDPQSLASRRVSTKESDDYVTDYLSEYCGCQHQWYWSGAFYAIKGLLLIFGCFLAYETRTVNLPGLNDSKFIGMCVYNVVVLCVVGITVSLVMKDKETVTYAFQASCMFLCATTTLSLLFIPKIAFVFRHPEQRVGKKPSVRQHATASCSVSNSNSSTGSATFNYMMDKQQKKSLHAQQSINSVLMTKGLPKDIAEAIRERENKLKVLEEENSKLEAMKKQFISVQSADGATQTVDAMNPQISSDVSHEVTQGGKFNHILLKNSKPIIIIPETLSQKGIEELEAFTGSDIMVGMGKKGYDNQGYCEC